MIEYLVLLFVLNGTSEQIMTVCNEVYDKDTWSSLTPSNKEQLNLCRIIDELNLSKKDVDWLNGPKLDWINYANQSSYDFITHLDLYKNYGIKDTLQIKAVSSLRDSLPPGMASHISFDYTMNGKKGHFDEQIEVRITGVHLTLKQQKNAHLDPSEMYCNTEQFTLAFKRTSGEAVCVYTKSILKLIERGWAKPF
jgi:hypothetical protein